MLHRSGIKYVLMLVSFIATDSIAAKDVARLWYFGGQLAYHSTQATLKSNADEPGDPRPDDFVSRRMGLEDTASLNLVAGFGLTRRLSLLVDAGYFKGRVGAIDVYLEDTFPKSADPARPEILSTTAHRRTTIPLTVGQIMEVPVGVTGLLRFRQDRTMNPYLGAGLGMVFAGIEDRQEVEDLNTRLASLRIKGETSESNRNLVPAKYDPLRAQGKIPLTYPISADVRDGFEWHLVAGMEYFLADRVSVIADVRYTFAVSEASVELKGEDQVNFQIFSEKLFRSDGSLKVFESGGMFPNPLVVPNDFSKGTVKCTPETVGDFDHDGHADDYCYTNNPNKKSDDPEGVLLVQGGKLGLSGYNIQVGMRFYF